MTIAIAAVQLSMLPRQVRRWCMRLGYLRAGRDWHLTATQVERIRKATARG